MTVIELSQVLGNFGEFVGAFAVVATLAYLSVQVKLSRVATSENNRFMRAAAIDTHFEQYNGIRRMVASNPDVARIWLAGREGDALDPIEDLRFKNLAIDYVLVHSNMATRGAAIGDREMVEFAIRTLKESILGSPGLARIWREGVGQSLRRD